MNNDCVLMAEIEGLLRAIESECENIRYKSDYDYNVYDVSTSIDKIKQYVDAITTKTTSIKN